MWTSRETSPRASPSNSLRRPAAAVLFLAAGLIAAAPAAADFIILRSGPRFGRGIPYLGANVIPYERGIYTFRGTTVEVYLVRRPIPLLSSWRPFRCGELPVYELPGLEPPAYFVVPRDGTGLFFRPDTRDVLCPFVTAVLPRLVFFLSVVGDGAALPALIELP